jgi:hypothetical protein
MSFQGLLPGEFDPGGEREMGSISIVSIFTSGNDFEILLLI